MFLTNNVKKKSNLTKKFAVFEEVDDINWLSSVYCVRKMRSQDTYKDKWIKVLKKEIECILQRVYYKWKDSISR